MRTHVVDRLDDGSVSQTIAHVSVRRALLIHARREARDAADGRCKGEGWQAWFVPTAVRLCEPSAPAAEVLARALWSPTAAGLRAAVSPPVAVTATTSITSTTVPIGISVGGGAIGSEVLFVRRQAEVHCDGRRGRA